MWKIPRDIGTLYGGDKAPSLGDMIWRRGELVIMQSVMRDWRAVHIYIIDRTIIGDCIASSYR